MKVKGRVAASHVPLLVKTGVRSWKAKRVPVGRRLARWAVLVKVWEIARWGRDGVGGSSGGGDAEISGAWASETEEVVVVVVGEDGVGLTLRAIFLDFWRMDL